jgi:aromatic-L-amino-acid decarboxylase
MRLDALADCVSRDEKLGRVPFCVVATAGTTSTGAVDDLRRLVEFSRERRLWFHVDAAYGGCFALTERGKAVLSGIEQADSVVLDPHKSLFTPFGTGCLLVRDVGLLQRAHELHSDYIEDLVDVAAEAGATNFADLSLELTRGMRGLRIWLPLKLLGAAAFRRALDEKLDLARTASAQIQGMPGFELLAPPELSILAFRAVEPGASPQQLDALNLAVLERVNRRGRVHLSATRVEGRVALRICVLSLRSHEPALAGCLRDLRECRGQGLPQSP